MLKLERHEVGILILSIVIAVTFAAAMLFTIDTLVSDDPIIHKVDFYPTASQQGGVWL